MLPKAGLPKNISNTTEYSATVAARHIPIGFQFTNTEIRAD